MFRVGLISDTHNLLRPDVADFLRGSDYIIHAGDVCDSSIVEELAALAPVTVVRGNNDRGAWAERLSETQLVQVGDILVYVIHDLAQLDLDPKAAGVRAIVSGHSHKPQSKSAAAFSTSTPEAQGHAASSCRSRSASSSFAATRCRRGSSSCLRRPPAVRRFSEASWPCLLRERPAKGPHDRKLLRYVTAWPRTREIAARLWDRMPHRRV